MRGYNVMKKNKFSFPVQYYYRTKLTFYSIDKLCAVIVKLVQIKNTKLFLLFFKLQYEFIKLRRLLAYIIDNITFGWFYRGQRLYKKT